MNGDVNEVDATPAALADPTRRKVIDLLREGPGRRACAGRPDERARAEQAPAGAARVGLAAGAWRAEPGGDDARLRLCTLRQEPFLALRGVAGPGAGVLGRTRARQVGEAADGHVDTGRVLAWEPSRRLPEVRRRATRLFQPQPGRTGVS
ncbi:hypothetical protein AB0C18_22850 [Nonomuraea muscovyensis]|uniref:hypothetical protein n=1 Tax=Nonomuraea muscovyensis TaxID=1124761 RepID=UPI0033CA11CB